MSERIVLALASRLEHMNLTMAGLHMCAYLYVARYGGSEFRWTDQGPFSPKIDSTIAWLATHGTLELKDGIMTIQARKGVPEGLEEGCERVAMLVEKLDTEGLVHMASVLFWTKKLIADTDEYGPLEVERLMTKAGIDPQKLELKRMLGRLESAGFVD